MFSPAVITSKPAQQHMDNIKVQHGDVLMAMASQRDRLLGLQAQKDEEIKNNQVMAMEMQKEQMAHQTEAMKIQAQTQKDMMQHTQKTQELDIKRQALSTV